MRKVAILAGLWTTFACAFAQAVQMTPYLEREPNNRISTPQVIDTPVDSTRGFVVWEALIQSRTDQDFYRFEVTQSGTYSIRVDTNLDTVLRLYDSSDSLIEENNNDGNPDLPLNRLASGLSVELSPGVYTVEVSYIRSLGRARYALRVFPGTVAPDYEPGEPNDTEFQAVYLGRISGGEFITNDYRFLSYGGGDTDVYSFDLDNTGQTLTIRTQTYTDTVLRVQAPDGRFYENDESEWDILNPGASEVRINLAPRGTYYVYVRSNPGWGGYYRLRVSVPLPSELVLQDGNAEFRLRSLSGSPTRSAVNNADWKQGTRDHFYQMGWWYRIQDTHSREFCFANLTYYDQERPNCASLTYLEPGGLAFATVYELKRTPDGGSILYADIAVLNLQPQPRTVHVFHYSDLDVSGTTTNLADWESERVRVSTNLDRVWLSILTPFTRWQVDAYPALIDRLLDTEPTDLTDGTLPLEGDFSGALQWTLVMQPFSYQTLRLAYTLNSGFIPTSSDTNRNGCTDDFDLLQVLYDFGREGFLLSTDTNSDGVVNDADLLNVLLNFGRDCE